jgi:predicted ribosomally synthesized peptide with nif11-like leader
MSKENFAQFMQQVQQDPLLQQKLAAAPDKEQASRLAVELGTQLGLEFTTTEVLNSMTGELEESELDAVAGGVFSPAWETEEMKSMETIESAVRISQSIAG